MKRVLAFAAALWLALWLSPGVAAAEGALTLVLRDTVAQNSEITVEVHLSHTEGVTTIAVVPEFDRSSFTLMNGRWEVNSDISDFNVATGDGVLAFGEPTELNGLILSFTLRAAPDAVGSHTVKCTVVLTADGQSQTLEAQGRVEVQCAHSYENACDTDCDLCGAVREAVHLYENGLCTLCGAQKPTQPAQPAPTTQPGAEVTATGAAPTADPQAPTRGQNEASTGQSGWLWIAGIGAALLTAATLWWLCRRRTLRKEEETNR